MRWLYFIVVSCAYWFLASILWVMAATAPCGLAPGLWCDIDGPPTVGIILEAIGPLGVSLMALAIYAIGAGLFFGRRKAR